MKLLLAPFATLALLVAACGSPAEEDPATTDVPADEPAAMPPESETVMAIPEEMRGRWGLVEADCDPTRDDAKGLMTVDAENLAFYESRAMLGTVSDAEDDEIHATFEFSGEGQTWQEEMSLELEDGGQKLVRTIFSETDMTQPLEYSRCS